MLAEYLACRRDPAHFVDRYCQLYNATVRGWSPFRLWPAQRQVLAALAEERFVLLLKARQLGMSWLCLGYALWLMLFRPAATVLLMSKRDDEAVELLARRLAPMHLRLPGWLQAGRVVRSSGHELRLSNGSRALAVPTTGGRSYTATLALLDEADYLPDLDAALSSLKPATDAGGQLVLVSTADKRRPTSPFKQLFRTVYFERAGAYRALFLPWQARPDRDRAWYERVAAEMEAQSGGPDALWQEYPATVEQALAPLQRDKRLPLAWIEACTAGAPPVPGTLSLPGLTVYALPQPGRRYVIGADPAEGLEAGDESAAAVLDAGTGEEVAALAGKLPPAPFAASLAALAAAYHDAGVLVERNNHGHAVLLALAQEGRTRLLAGPEGGARAGWLTTARQKALLYDWAAEALRTRATLLHSGATALQLPPSRRRRSPRRPAWPTTAPRPSPWRWPPAASTLCAASQAPASPRPTRWRRSSHFETQRTQRESKGERCARARGAAARPVVSFFGAQRRGAQRGCCDSGDWESEAAQRPLFAR